MIVFGDNYLSKSNPIFRQLAGIFWSVGIIGLQFEPEISLRDLHLLCVLVNSLRQEKKQLTEVKDRYQNKMPAAITLDLLSKELFQIQQTDQISKLDPGKETELWENFIFSLEDQTSDAHSDKLLSKSVIELARKLTRQGHSRESVQYDKAVVNYLRSLDKNYRKKGILSQSNLGKKIGEFISNINPDLRQQILCTTLTSKDLSPTMQQELAQIVDHEHMIESLKKLNSEGRAIPVTVYRTLSLLSMLGENAPKNDHPEDEELDLAEAEQENLQALLETLLSEDNRFSYMSAEYDEKIESLQEYAEELAQTRDYESSRVLFERSSVEKHFIGIQSELLDRFPEDVELGGNVSRQINKNFMFFLENMILQDCLQCVAVGKRAVVIDPKRQVFPYAWEHEDVQEQIIRILNDKSNQNKAYARMILSSIGEKILPKLIDLLLHSDEMAIRRQLINIFVEMEENPSETLLSMLNLNVPWYAQRNIIYILRRRRESSGQEVILAHWDESHPKVRVEIIRYLYAVRNREWMKYLEDALFSKSNDLVLGAARMVLQVRWDEIVELIIQKAEQIPRWQVGSDLHMELIQLLLMSKNKKAKTYVTSLVVNKQGLFPWQTSRFRESVRRMMRGVRN